MTLLTMSQTEITRLQVIMDVAERRLTRAQAGDLLGLSSRQVQRLVNRYRLEGAAGLMSRKRGVASNRRYPGSLREYTLSLLRAQYADFGPTLAAEKLLECHEIGLSVGTVRQWMIADGLWKTRKEQRSRVYQPRRRRECYGELIQIDGSDHHWFEERGPRCTLLVYIDDATGRLMELRFCASESTFDYFYATREYLANHGKPVAFYSDKHSVFRVNKGDATTGTGMTQFGRALHELNIDIICANTSQAKGRVERANKTLQDRLVKELRLRGIDTPREANAFAPEFIADFNRRFSREPLNPKDIHRPLESDTDLDDVFAWREERTVSNSLTVQYDRVVYLLEPNEQTTPLRRKKVTVYDYPDGTIAIKHRGLPLPYSIFDKVSQVNQGAIVSNKRLGAVLAYAQEEQQKMGYQRSQKAPKRRGQKQVMQDKVRQVNPASQG